MPHTRLRLRLVLVIGEPTSPGRPADSVDVVLGPSGHAVVDHQVAGGDVKSPTREIGGHKNSHLVGLEQRHRLQSQLLPGHRVQDTVGETQLLQYHAQYLHIPE